MAKIRGKNYLILDLETSGLPITRPGACRYAKYPSPKCNIAYDTSRLLSIAYTGITNGSSSETVIHEIRNNSDLPESCYITNRNKYPNKSGKFIDEILREFANVINDYEFIVGQNIMFDLHILLNEYYRYNTVEFALQVELGLADYNFCDSAIRKLEEIISECKYFCTLEYAIQLGIEGKDISLEKLYNMLEGTEPLKFHDADHDVMATKFIVQRILQREDLPGEIVSLIKEIYPAKVFGSRDLIETGEYKLLTIRIPESSFEYYCGILDAILAEYHFAGFAEFYIKEMPIRKICTLDGMTGESKYTHMLLEEDTYTVCKCGYKVPYSGLCETCSNTDSALYAYYDFLKLEPQYLITVTTSEFKNMLKDKGKLRRKLSIDFPVAKKGRSNVVPQNLVKFYIENQMYLYFSAKVGSVKL
jgi:hypothetical protein